MEGPANVRYGLMSCRDAPVVVPALGGDPEAVADEAVVDVALGLFLVELCWIGDGGATIGFGAAATGTRTVVTFGTVMYCGGAGVA